MRSLMRRLLACTENSADFAARLLREPRVGDCEECYVTALRVADALADEKRISSRLLFENETPARVCRSISSSKPPAWPPVPRWPELEAIVDARHAAPQHKFLEILRNLQLLERGSSRLRTLLPTSFVRSYLLSQATPAEVGWAGLIAGSAQVQARAYREQSLCDETSVHDRWREAADLLDPTPEDVRELGPRITPWRAMVYAGVIDEAVAHLERLEQVASTLCIDTTARGYAYSVVNLVRVEDGTIEAIAGTGESIRWVGRVRHPIHPHMEWQEQDIQCEIVLSRTAELVLPDDSRLDSFVKEHFGHTSPRLFIPLIVVQDADGKELNDSCQWEVLRPDPRPILRLVTPEGGMPRAFGTLEVGIEDMPRALGDFTELATFALRRAAELYRCTLPHVLDSIVKVVRRITRAHSATLHLGRTTSHGAVCWNADYCFRSNAEKAVSWLSPSDCMDGDIGGTPRPNGLGEEALRRKEWGRREGDELALHNPKIRNQGYHSMTAFPLFAGANVGLIYVHQKEARYPGHGEMRLIEFVIKRASSCIRVARAYTAERDRSAQILGQLKTANALSVEVGRPLEERGKLATGSLLELTASDLSLLFRVHKSTQHEFPDSGISLGTTADRGLIIPLIRRAAQTRQPQFYSYQDLEQPLDREQGPNSATLDRADEWAELASARAFLEHESTRYLAILPLHPDRKGTLVAVLVFRRELELDAVEKEHLALLASTVTSALDMAGARQQSVLQRLRAMAGGRPITKMEITPSFVATAWSFGGVSAGRTQ